MAIDNSCFIPLTDWVEPAFCSTIERNLAWPIDDTCCTALTTALVSITNPSPEYTRLRLLWSRAKAAAIDIMYTKTCSAYDLCDYSFRPCMPHTCCGGNDLLGVNFCSDECSRVSLDIHDWANPFYSVTSVIKYDGAGVATQLEAGVDYEVDGHLLVPYITGGLWPWPRQSRQYPLNYISPNPAATIVTWEVRVRRGTMPPQSVITAAGSLACNMFNLCVGAPCDIPSNATSVTKEGITVRLETNILKAIPLVAAAIETYGDCKKSGVSRLIDPAIWVN